LKTMDTFRIEKTILMPTPQGGIVGQKKTTILQSYCQLYKNTRSE
jgi:hypothetical protein